MKVPHLLRILLLIALPLLVAGRGSASSLQGRVTEIFDGATLSVVSVNHSVRIKLIGIAPPEKTQAYSDQARQHLSDLILEKYVLVKGSQLGHGFIAGKVLLNEVDVGAQMIRDGVAWYDKSEESYLNADERQLYAGCEQAARSERRGLWQDEAPLAPWEFRRQLEARPTPSSPESVTSRVSSYSARRSGQGLASDDLLRSFASTGPKGTAMASATGLSDSGWKTFMPAGGRFSVLVPGNAVDGGATVPTPTGQTADINYCFGRRGKNSYLVLSAKGPGDSAADSQVADDTVNSLILDLNRNAPQNGGPNFGIKRERVVSVGGYTGWQYRISGSKAPGIIRIFSKRTGPTREVYVIGVLNSTEEDPQVAEFLNSFKIGGK